jgi:hypothetical protein
MAKPVVVTRIVSPSSQPQNTMEAAHNGAAPPAGCSGAMLTTLTWAVLEIFFELTCFKSSRQQ